MQDLSTIRLKRSTALYYNDSMPKLAFWLRAREHKKEKGETPDRRNGTPDPKIGTPGPTIAKPGINLLQIRP